MQLAKGLNGERAIIPLPTNFIVNVIPVHPASRTSLSTDPGCRLLRRRAEAGFLWSKLSKNTDGLTVVNIEAISYPGDVEVFFSDPVFLKKFCKLDTVSSSEFHTYTVGELVRPEGLRVTG
ncbi:hypothetical protein QO004_002934 [Rhizobium mesoamericanum]|nr:hypothetical protein [Rhizobium mesoamericanum]